MCSGETRHGRQPLVKAGPPRGTVPRAKPLREGLYVVKARTWRAPSWTRSRAEGGCCGAGRCCGQVPVCCRWRRYCWVRSRLPALPRKRPALAVLRVVPQAGRPALAVLRVVPRAGRPARPVVPRGVRQAPPVAPREQPEAPWEQPAAPRAGLPGLRAGRRVAQPAPPEGRAAERRVGVGQQEEAAPGVEVPAVARADLAVPERVAPVGRQPVPDPPARPRRAVIRVRPLGEAAVAREAVTTRVSPPARRSSSPRRPTCSRAALYCRRRRSAKRLRTVGRDRRPDTVLRR